MILKVLLVEMLKCLSNISWTVYFNKSSIYLCVYETTPTISSDLTVSLSFYLCCIKIFLFKHLTILETKETTKAYLSRPMPTIFLLYALRAFPWDPLLRTTRCWHSAGKDRSSQKPWKFMKQGNQLISPEKL